MCFANINYPILLCKTCSDKRKSQKIKLKYYIQKFDKSSWNGMNQPWFFLILYKHKKCVRGHTSTRV
jgi:hypothetical protein